MRIANPRSQKALTVCALVAGAISLSACATEDYVDKHIAAVNARIDQTDGRLSALEGRVNEVGQRADAGIAAAQAAAQAANSAAQSAAADAQRANQGLDELRPTIAHLEMHHRYKTWRDVHPIHKRKMAAKRSKSAKKRAKKA